MEHFRRSIPFGFNYDGNGHGEHHQILNRVRNLTNSLYAMKRKFVDKESDGMDNLKVIEPSQSLVGKAYAVFDQLNDDLIRIYGHKLNVVEGENWNERQE